MPKKTKPITELPPGIHHLHVGYALEVTETQKILHTRFSTVSPKYDGFFGFAQVLEDISKKPTNETPKEEPNDATA